MEGEKERKRRTEKEEKKSSVTSKISSKKMDLLPWFEISRQNNPSFLPGWNNLLQNKRVLLEVLLKGRRAD